MWWLVWLVAGAMQLGAMECVGVDICYDALSNADVNTKVICTAMAEHWPACC